MLLMRYLDTHDRAIRFVQIGANDGCRFDPLYEVVGSGVYGLTGLVVEPVPRFYKALKRVYQNQPGVEAVNAAIHNSLAEMTLYVVSEEYESQVPEWALGTASFNKAHVVKPEVPASYVEAIMVPCFSLDALMSQYRMEHIDLLQIDTEGYDSEIILNMDFSRVKPALIHFEHGISDGVMARGEFDALINHLNQHGYQVLPEKYDAVAYLPHEVGQI